MGEHDRAVRALIKGTQTENSVDTTRADNVGKYPDPSPIGGEVPDIVFEFSNGHTTIVEVDTKPMSSHDEKRFVGRQLSDPLQVTTTSLYLMYCRTAASERPHTGYSESDA
jgi:hypothetical protein